MDRKLLSRIFYCVFFSDHFYFILIINKTLKVIYLKSQGYIYTQNELFTVVKIESTFKEDELTFELP